MAEEMMMVPTTDYANLVNYYKGRLTESALLNKASRLAAERGMVLENPKIPTSLALAVAEPKAREVQRLTKRLRSAGVQGATVASTVDADDDDFLKTPLDSKLDKILRATTKRSKMDEGGDWVEVVRPPPRHPRERRQRRKKEGGGENPSSGVL